MQIQIQVLSVTSESKKTAKGTSYVMLDIAYKNLTSGKVEGKKLVPFGDGEAVYGVFKDAQAGNQFRVTLEKGEQYWNWTKAEAIAPGSAPPAQEAKAGVAAPRSTYETPEERAKKQVYIINQSSIGSAIELLAIGAKSPPSVQQVLDVAAHFTNWVLSERKVPLQDLPNDLEEGDVPL